MVSDTEMVTGRDKLTGPEISSSYFGPLPSISG